MDTWIWARQGNLNSPVQIVSHNRCGCIDCYRSCKDIYKLLSIGLWWDRAIFKKNSFVSLVLSCWPDLKLFSNRKRNVHARQKKHIQDKEKWKVFLSVHVFIFLWESWLAVSCFYWVLGQLHFAMLLCKRLFVLSSCSLLISFYPPSQLPTQENSMPGQAAPNTLPNSASCQYNVARVKSRPGKARGPVMEVTAPCKHTKRDGLCFFSASLKPVEWSNYILREMKPTAQIWVGTFN